MFPVILPLYPISVLAISLGTNQQNILLIVPILVTFYFNQTVVHVQNVSENNDL
jgi:hypothetical protein